MFTILAIIALIVIGGRCFWKGIDFWSTYKVATNPDHRRYNEVMKIMSAEMLDLKTLKKKANTRFAIAGVAILLAAALSTALY